MQLWVSLCRCSQCNMNISFIILVFFSFIVSQPRKDNYKFLLVIITGRLCLLPLGSHRNRAVGSQDLLGCFAVYPRSGWGFQMAKGRALESAGVWEGLGDVPDIGWSLVEDGEESLMEVWQCVTGPICSYGVVHSNMKNFCSAQGTLCTKEDAIFLGLAMLGNQCGDQQVNQGQKVPMCPPALCSGHSSPGWGLSLLCCEQMPKCTPGWCHYRGSTKVTEFNHSIFHLLGIINLWQNGSEVAAVSHGSS